MGWLEITSQFLQCSTARATPVLHLSRKVAATHSRNLLFFPFVRLADTSRRLDADASCWQFPWHCHAWKPCNLFTCLNICETQLLHFLLICLLVCPLPFPPPPKLSSHPISPGYPSQSPLACHTNR